MRTYFGNGIESMRKERARRLKGLGLSGLQCPESIIGDGSFVQQRRHLVVGTTNTASSLNKNLPIAKFSWFLKSSYLMMCHSFLHFQFLPCHQLIPSLPYLSFTHLILLISPTCHDTYYHFSVVYLVDYGTNSGFHLRIINLSQKNPP